MCICVRAERRGSSGQSTLPERERECRECEYVNVHFYVEDEYGTIIVGMSI
jgi:hypothetical protein